MLHLAVLLPTANSWAAGRASAGAISLGVADANKKFPVKLSYTMKEVDCDATQATAAISVMLDDDVVDAVIGPDCDVSCESSAYLTAGRNIAQISYSCSSDLLSNKKKYPTVRVPSQSQCLDVGASSCAPSPRPTKVSCVVVPVARRVSSCPCPHASIQSDALLVGRESSGLDSPLESFSLLRSSYAQCPATRNGCPL